MTEGDRIVQEFSPRMGLTVAEEEELAQRIDAALAECERDRVHLHALLEWIEAIIHDAAPVSEFALSFPIVRETQDLRNALAERDREHNAALAACATTGGQWGEEILELRAKLAEREAQCTLLSHALEQLQDHHCGGMCALDHDAIMALVNDALNPMADTARAFVEHLRAETREECAQVVDAAIRQGSGILDEIAAAIRALGPKEK